MGKIYSTEGIAETPKIDFNNIKLWEENEEKYIKQVSDWAKQKGDSEYSGEMVSFPYADGAASYIILSLKPVKLLHLEIGDAWDIPYANRLTAKDLKDQVNNHKKLKELFGSKK